MAIECGASALGLVSRMPSGPGPIPNELIARIAKSIPPPVMSVLLTSERDAQSIIRQHRVARTLAIQLVDSVRRGCYDTLRQALPGIRLIQVIHVRGEESVEEAREVSDSVDAILLDSGNPGLAVKELGGTGRVHDWLISAMIRKESGIPIILAGGLNSWNVRLAIESIEPFAVDVCSGVRTDGTLDRRKLEEFMLAAGIRS